MSLPINTSPDINLLSVDILYDISGVTPSITLTNQSQGNNLAAVEYAFTVKAPDTTFIHQGDIASPDQTGIWATFVIGDQWPMPFGNIEFSGAPYSFQVTCKDSNGNIFVAPVQLTFICRPNGNLPTSKNPYGLGAVSVQTKCDQARIYFQDVTNTSYKGISGVEGSSVLRVNFPMDNTGTVPPPFQINYFSTAMVPITFSGKGYQFLYTSIWDYDLGQQSTVRIKYLLSDTFGVFCNIDLMPLVCEYQKLINSIETGSCNDVQEANRKLMLINPKMALVGIGMMQPLTGVDVPLLIQQIEDIGGFDCDCCNAPTGIVPAGSSAFDGYTFSVVPECGDIIGEFVANGFNIQLHLSDVTYVFKMCDSSPAESTAFEIRSSIDGCQKTYCLFVDIVQLAEDILNAISTNAGLVNLFNSIVNINPGNFKLIVDGKCIFSSGTSFNYEFGLTGIPENTTFALLETIQIGAVLVPLSHSFNMTSLAGLQTYLNSLGYGTFTVVAATATSVTITSTTNPTDINALIYSPDGSSDNFASMIKTATGFTPLPANQVVQMIIDYICNLDDSEVKTSAVYEICWVDGEGVKQTETINEGQPLTEAIAALAEKGCLSIDYIVSLKSVDCTNVKALFPQLPENVMQANDVFLGTKEGACAGIYPVEAFLMMLTYGQYNSDVVAAFCKMVELCGGGKPCAPYNVFFAEVDYGSPTSELVVTFDHPDAVSNKIRYARIDNTVEPIYTTIEGVLPGDSPYTISGISNGQYRVCITPVYADGRSCSETCYDTLPCTGIIAFSAVYTDPNIVINFTVQEGVNFLKVNLSYPNGGSFSQVYNLSSYPADEINIAPPVNVFGTFFATIQPVCDNDTGWVGAPSAPASFEIPETSP